MPPNNVKVVSKTCRNNLVPPRKALQQLHCALVGPAETFRAWKHQIASSVHWLDSAPDIEWITITETPLVFWGRMEYHLNDNIISFYLVGPNFFKHIVVIPQSDALPSDMELLCASSGVFFLGFLGPLLALIRLLASFTSASVSFRHSFSSVMNVAISAGVKAVAQLSFSIIRAKEAPTKSMWPSRLLTSLAQIQWCGNSNVQLPVIAEHILV